MSNYLYENEELAPFLTKSLINKCTVFDYTPRIRKAKLYIVWLSIISFFRPKLRNECAVKILLIRDWIKKCPAGVIVIPKQKPETSK